MIIEKLQYDADGDLLTPTDRALERVLVVMGSPVTTDPGHWHRVRLNGWTPKELDALMASTAKRLEQIPGLGVWRCTTSTRPAVDGSTHHLADIIYCIPEQS